MEFKRNKYVKDEYYELMEKYVANAKQHIDLSLFNLIPILVLTWGNNIYKICESYNTNTEFIACSGDRLSEAILKQENPS